MLLSTKEIAGFSRNNVVSLKELKGINYYLYKLYLNNKDLFDELLLLNHQVCILNDIRFRRTTEQVRLYLLYHYGKDINISELRRINYNAYKNMCMVGGVSYFRGLGFNFTYDKKFKYIKKLKSMCDKNGYLLPPKQKHYPKMYNALRTSAYNKGMTYVEYLQHLGFKIKDRKDWKDAENKLR
ncbi:MAG TPA: hypothetical protein VFD00_05975 [Thermoclostridium sp.]|nr:hypothetical protein [Thermoclostridium sp.]